MLLAIKFATMARQLINMADPPAPSNAAIAKISYFAESHFSQPNKTHMHPPNWNRNFKTLITFCEYVFSLSIPFLNIYKISENELTETNNTGPNKCNFVPEFVSEEFQDNRNNKSWHEYDHRYHCNHGIIQSCNRILNIKCDIGLGNIDEKSSRHVDTGNKVKLWFHKPIPYLHCLMVTKTTRHWQFG